MPCGWVDISLSITSVGSSSFGSRFSGGNPLRIYASDKENRIHLGAILCTTEGKNSLHDVELPPRLALRLPGQSQSPSAINHQDLPGHEFRLNQEYNGVGYFRWSTRAAKR